MADIERAIAIASSGHQGQRDKAGQPYILHPLRVMFRMSSSTEMIVAVLHDLLEDTHWTLELLKQEGFSDTVLNAIDQLTRKQNESYEGFIERVGKDPLASRVKLADLEDNMDITRFGSLTQKDMDRLEKYHRAWTVLQSGLDA